MDLKRLWDDTNLPVEVSEYFSEEGKPHVPALIFVNVRISSQRFNRVAKHLSQQPFEIREFAGLLSELVNFTLAPDQVCDALLTGL